MDEHAHDLGGEALLAGQRRAMELALRGAPLGALLEALALALEEHFERQLFVSILLLDPTGERLVHGAAPSLPNDYNRAIDGLAIGEGVGSCGTAAFTARPVVVSDIQSDPLWADFKDLAARSGIAACWSAPIFSALGGVMGTFAIYSPVPREPTAEERSTVRLLANTVAFVIELSRAQSQLRSSAEFLVRLDDAQRPLSAPEEITLTAATLLGEQLHVNRCAYAYVEADQDTFQLTGNYTHGAPTIVGRYRFRQFGAECLRLMRAGAPYVVQDSARDSRIDEDDRRAYELTTIRGVICVPVTKSGQFVAAMAVHTTEPRAWQPHEVELVQQVASRSWESIERAKLAHEREELLVRERVARQEADSLRLSAESANRAKDEFLAILGHELRNPLSPILTALELLKIKRIPGTERERTVIERQVSHLTRLVDDLLDVARIAKGKVGLRRETLELAEVVSKAVELISPLIEERAHHVTVDVPQHGLPIYVDPIRLIQVVSNLLANAAKYTAPGGLISMKAWPSGEQVVLQITDTGVGIAPETLPHVFDLFVQERQSSDRAAGGLGLGLTIARNLIDSHGGTITAESPGREQGSVFTVTLPLASGQIAASPQADRAQVPHSKDTRRVLIVDDNEDAAEMLAAVLSALGHQVQVALDGPSAIEVARRFEPEVGLLDLGLPVMDGYELAGRLREIPGLEAIRLIALTGYGQESDRVRTGRSGFQQHLVKPVDFASLGSVIQQR